MTESNVAEERIDRIRGIAERAMLSARQSINLDYIAIPRSAWEDICFELTAEKGRRLLAADNMRQQALTQATLSPPEVSLSAPSPSPHAVTTDEETTARSYFTHDCNASWSLEGDVPEAQCPNCNVLVIRRPRRYPTASAPPAVSPENEG